MASKGNWKHFVPNVFSSAPDFMMIHKLMPIFAYGHYWWVNQLTGIHETIMCVKCRHGYININDLPACLSLVKKLTDAKVISISSRKPIDLEIEEFLNLAKNMKNTSIKIIDI